MKLYLVVGVLGVMVTACMPAIPIVTPKGPPKRASEVANSAALEPRDGAGVIDVTRVYSVLRLRCTYNIALDGEFLAGLRTGEHVTIYADPGARTLSVSIRPEKNCEPALAQVPLQVVAHATTTVRIVADAKYDLKIEATTY